jgi:peptidoglycan/xylan/chitin deacetylase (PgdA/CDA1 family)
MENEMKRLSIVMYHYVRPIAKSEYPGIKGLELDLFRQQIQFFRDNFNVVTMEQVIDYLDGKCPLPEKAMLLTFDDGYSDHYQYVFHVLQEYGMQGSFFVPSGILQYKKVLDVNKIHFILACTDIEVLLPKVFNILDAYRKEGWEIEPNEVLFDKLAVANRWDAKEVIFVKRLLQSYLEEELRGKIVDCLFLETVGVSEEEFSEKLYMKLEQIQEMKAAGMFFGLHGERHYWLNHLPEEKMKEDILNGLEYFQSVIDRDYIVMNYPYGGYNEKVLEYVSQIGCKLGFSVEARHADLDRDNPLILPRLDTNDFPPKSEHWREEQI